MGTLDTLLAPVRFFFDLLQFIYCVVFGFFSGLVEFFGYLWNYKELILITLVLWFVAALYIRFQPEIMEEADYFYRCVLKPWYDDVWRPFWQWIEDVYFILICWWNGGVETSRLTTRIALDIIFQCGGKDEAVRVAESIATLFVSIFQAFFELLFVPPGLLENRLPAERVAEAFGEMTQTLRMYFCCLCQDLCFVTDLIAGFFSDPFTHCAFGGFVNFAVRISQILLGFFADVSGFLFAAMAISFLPIVLLASFLQSFGLNFLIAFVAIMAALVLISIFTVVAVQVLSLYELNLTTRPNFRPAFRELCNGFTCLGIALQNLLVAGVDLFVELTDPDAFPDFFCPLAQLMCAASNAAFVALDFAFNLDNLFFSVLEFMRPILVFFGVPESAILDTPVSFQPDYVQQINFDLIYDRIREPPQVELCAAQNFTGEADWNGFENYWNCTEVFDALQEDLIPGTNRTLPAFVDCFCDAFDLIDPTQYLSLTQEPLLCCTLEKGVKAAVATAKVVTDLINLIETPEDWACVDRAKTCMVVQWREIFAQLYNKDQDSLLIPPEEQAQDGLLECVCKIWNQAVLIIGKRVGSAGIDADDVNNCCYPFAVFYGTLPVLDVPFLQLFPVYDLAVAALDFLRILVELVMSLFEFSNYLFCNDPDCADWDTIIRRIKHVGRCNCEYLARLNVLQDTFIGGFINDILACVCIVIVGLYDMAAELLRWVVVLLGNFDDFPLIDIPDLDAFLDAASGGFVGTGCLIGAIFRNINGDPCDAWEEIFLASYQGLVATVRITEAVLDNLFSDPGQILPEILTAIFEPFVCFEQCPANVPPGEPSCILRNGLFQAFGNLIDCYVPGGFGQIFVIIGNLGCTILQALVSFVTISLDLIIALFQGDFSGVAEALRDLFFLFLNSFVDFFVEFIPEVFKFIINMILSIITFGALRDVHLKRSTLGWTESDLLRITVEAVCTGFEEASSSYDDSPVCSVHKVRTDSHTEDGLASHRDQPYTLQILVDKHQWDASTTCGKLAHLYADNDYEWSESPQFSEHSEGELWACVLARNFGQMASERFGLPDVGEYLLDREDQISKATHWVAGVMQEMNHIAEVGEIAFHRRNHTEEVHYVPYAKAVREDPSQFVDDGVLTEKPAEEARERVRVFHPGVNMLDGKVVSQRLSKKLHSFLRDYHDPHRPSVMEMYMAKQTPIHEKTKELRRHLGTIAREVKKTFYSGELAHAMGRAAYGVYHYGGSRLRSLMQAEWHKREEVVEHILRKGSDIEKEQDIAPAMKRLLLVKGETEEDYFRRQELNEERTRMFDDVVLKQEERKLRYAEEDAIGYSSWWIPKSARALRTQLVTKNFMYNMYARWRGEDPGVNVQHRMEMLQLVEKATPTIVERAAGDEEEEERLHRLMDRFVFQDPFTPGDDCDCEYVETLLNSIFFIFRRCWDRTCYGDINITTPLCDAAIKPIIDLIPDPPTNSSWPNFDAKRSFHTGDSLDSHTILQKLRTGAHSQMQDSELRELFHEMQRSSYVFDLHDGDGDPHKMGEFMLRAHLRREGRKKERTFGEKYREERYWGAALVLDMLIGTTSPYASRIESRAASGLHTDTLRSRNAQRVVQQIQGLTEGFLDFIVNAVTFFFGSDAGDSTEQFYTDFLQWLFNPNIDLEAGPIGLAGYLIWPVRCNYRLQTTCSLGYGLLKGTLYTALGVLVVVVFAGLVFPPVLYLFDIVPWIYSLWPLRFQSYPLTFMVWMGLSFGFSTWCLPALPECLVAEWNLLLDTFLQWDCIQWPAGLIVDQAQVYPPCVECPERIGFVDCSEVGFDSFLAVFFYLLSVYFPVLYSFFYNSCVIRFFFPFQYLIDLLDVFWPRNYPDGELPPSFQACFVATAWAHLIPFVFFLVIGSAFLIVVVPRLITCFLALWVVLRNIFGGLFEDRTVYMVGDVENTSGISGSQQQQMNEEVGAELVGDQQPGGSRTGRGLRRRRRKERGQPASNALHIRAPRHDSVTESALGAGNAIVQSITDMWCNWRRTKKD